MAHRPYDETSRAGLLAAPDGAAEMSERAAAHFAAVHFVESSPDLLAISGFDGILKWVNAAHETLLGYPPEELVGRPYLELLHPDDRERALAEAAQLRRGGGPTTAFEARVLASDGTFRWILVSATPSPEEELVFSSGKDITERRQVEEELELAGELALAAAGTASVEDAIAETLARTCERTGWQLGQAWLPSADAKRLECSPAWHRGGPGGGVRLEPFRRLSEAFVFGRGNGLPGRAWETGEPAVAEDFEGPDELSRSSFAAQAGLRTGFGVPVKADDEVLAVLEFFSADPPRRDGRDLALACRAATQLGALIGRRRAEGALLRSERHFAAVARSAADAVISAGGDGRIQFFNEAATRAFGYSVEEAAGAPLTLILPELTHREALGGRTVELEGRRKGGAAIPLEGSFSVWEADGERFLTAVLRDVGERRQSEEQVHEAEERFRGAFEQAPIGMALVSIESDGAGCFLRANRALCEITGHEPDELVGRPFEEVVAPERAERPDRRYVPWMLAGELTSFETDTLMRCADGRELDALLSVSLVRDAHERPLYLIAQLQDVSARRDAERRVVESGERMQAILDNAPAIVYVKDLEGRYLLVNRQFEAVLDVGREQAIGRTDAELFEGERAELMRANDLRVMHEHLPLEVEEAIPQGERVRTYLSTKFPLLDATRRPYAVCGISTDITDRKRAEEGVRTSERHFREIVNTTHEAFISMDEDGRITAWNPEAEATFGWSEEDAIGRSLAETIVPPRYRGGHLQGLERFLRSGRGALLNRRIEIEALHRDGHEFPVEMTITAVRVGGRYAFNAFLHDIGARKQAEQTLRRLADIIESSHDAIFATTTNGEITSWNPGAERLYGYSAAEAVGSSLRMVVAPDLARRDFEALDHALAGHRLDDFETEQLRKDGSLVPVSLTVSPMRDPAGRVVGASLIVRDRTERKRAEEALREVQEAFRSAFEDAPIGMALFSVDPGADGRLLQVNRSLCEITGYGERELLGTSLHALTHPQDQGQELPLSEELLGGSIPNYQLEKRYVRRDGGVVWVMHNASSVHDSRGRLLYGIAQVQDISERKRAEDGLAKVAAELERRAGQLERSNADLQQFAYVASHDLSEPLRMVSSYVQLLERRYAEKLDQDAHDFIDFAVDGVNRMQRLIEDLLAYSRVGTSEVERKPVDVGALVDDTLAGMRATVAESGAIVTHEGLPTVPGDASQLRQLFQNLISNAIKFVEEGPPRIEVSAERERGAWRFCVADNGIGIDPQHADRIFAVFKRLHGREAYSGSGIGLSICKRIVERHEGRIWVERNEGGGSRFCFTIPAPHADDRRTDVGSAQ